jgi:hypothetical protein
MPRPLLRLNPRLTCWTIEMSHMVAVPKYIEATTMEELRSRVQEIADSKKIRTDRPAMGEITFRYEVDKYDQVNVVHSYFLDKHGKLRRFMRLRRAS